MIEVSTSLLNIPKEKIIKSIYDIEVAKTDYFHIDVMDGKFVKRDTTEQMKEYAEYVKQIANTPMEVHLMVEDVKNYVSSYLALEPSMIIFHYEACKNNTERIEIIKQIKQNNCKVGISIKPETSIADIFEFLPYVHRVLVMTVEPGEGGQELLPDTIKKINELNVFIYENGLDVDIEVDGGINEKTAPKVIDAGATILVAGSYIANATKYSEAIQTLKNSI